MRVNLYRCQGATRSEVHRVAAHRQASFHVPEVLRAAETGTMIAPPAAKSLRISHVGLRGIVGPG